MENGRELHRKVLRVIGENIFKIVLGALLYAALLGLGMFLAFLSSSLIGYLPYSDRPGPGWYGFGVPTWEETKFYWHFSIFMIGPMGLFWGAIFTVFARAIAAFGVPRWLVRVLGGFFASVLGLIAVAAAGWYIAIAPVFVYVGGSLGMLFGALVLPILAPRSVTWGPMSRWWRWPIVAAATGVLGFVLISPIVPDPDAQAIDVVVVRLVPGDSGSSFVGTELTKSEKAVLDSLGLHGELHVGLQEDFTNGEREARALIVVTGPVHSKVALREPKGTSVVYVQRGEEWVMFPAGAATLRKKIILTPGTDNGEKGLTMLIERSGRPTNFTW